MNRRLLDFLWIMAAGAACDAVSSDSQGIAGTGSSGAATASGEDSADGSPSGSGGSGPNGGSGDDGLSTATGSSEPDTDDGEGDDDEGDEATGTGGGSGDSSGGEAPVEMFSDEFDDPATLSQWRVLQQEAGETVPLSVLEIDRGRLTMVPTTSGWYGNEQGALLFKEVEGDFVVEVRVKAGKQSDIDVPPDQPFNSAGLLVRNPASSDRTENWVMHNVGRQAINPGSEGKTTVDSNSVLVTFIGPPVGRLRICRRDSTFVLVRRLGDDTEFTVTHEYERDDLPEAVQIGLVTNGWNSLGPMPDYDQEPDLEAEFDYIRIWETSEPDDCLQDEIDSSLLR